MGLYVRTWTAVFILAALLLLAGGYGYYRGEAERIRQTKYHDIAAIGALKVDQIQQWRQERRADARKASKSPFFRRALAEWRRNPDASELRMDWKKRLQLEQEAYGYADVLLLDPEGRILLAASDTPDPTDPATQQALATALAGRDAVLSDFYRAPHGGVYLDTVAPVFDAEGRPLAVLVLRSDAASYLYPLIQSWPTPSRSAETLLIRREGDAVVYLNELRHQANTALSLRAPLTQSDLPAARAVLGQQGQFQGYDYRGVEVLADLRPIPGSPWFLVTKVDTDEILAEARYRAWMITLFVLLGILLAAATTAIAYRQRQIGLYRDLYWLEQKQREAQEEFRITLYSIGDAVITTDPDGRIRQMNPVAEQLTGWPETEAQGQSLDKVFHIVSEETRAVVENPVQRVLSEGVIVGLANHTLLIARDGVERPIADSGAPIRDENGVMVGVVLVFRDQTEERAAEQEVRRNEARLRRLVSILQHPSDSVQDFLDYALNEAIQLTGSKIGYIYYYHEDRREFVLNSWSRGVMKECSVVNPETCYELDKTGLWGEAVRQRRPILVNDFIAAHPLKKGYPAGHARLLKYLTVPVFSGGEIVAVIGVANKVADYHETDILQLTLLMEAVWKVVERRSAEDKERQAVHKHDALEAQFHQAQKMDAVGRLAGGVAHDFNNMLAVITGHADMALEQIAPDSALHADLLEIRKAAQRSADLTHQLLAFARKQTTSPKILDLNDTIASMFKMLRRLIGENIDLLWKPAVGPVLVKMDPAQIDQILANLVVNARDAIAGVGKIIIETSQVTFDETYCETHAECNPGSYVLLAVSDNGSGMDQVVLARLFEPFFTTKPSGQGTGLGLATVYGIVKQNNGFIYVYSEPGKGATFRIYLPRHTLDLASANPVQRPVVAPLGTETVLLVEDEAALLKLNTRMLEQLGYTVLAAGSPNQAIQWADAHADPIHLLLTDVIMPEMSGRDLWQQLSGLRPGMKCVFMSGHTADVIAHHGVLDEGIHFLQKPFSREALATKLRKALSASEAAE
jgi:PAS domain S-box-containing protein